MKNKIISFFIIALVTAIVLFFSLKDDYITIINTILNINKIWLVIAFIFLFLYYFIRSYVMFHFASEFNAKFKFKDALKLTFETNFFHAVTPFSSGGQPYEIYSLNKNGLKITDSVNTSVENFIVYQIALVSLGVLAIAGNMLFNVLNSSVLKYFLTLGFLINLFVIVLLFAVSLSNNLDKKLLNFVVYFLHKIKIIKNVDDIKYKLSEYLVEFNDGSKLLLKNKKIFFQMIILELMSLIFLYLIPFALIMGVNSYINPVHAVITMSYVMLIGSFVPIPGGTGGLEFSFISFFGNFITGSKLNAIMLLWRFITYYFGMIFGAIVLNLKKGEKI